VSGAVIAILSCPNSCLGTRLPETPFRDPSAVPWTVLPLIVTDLHVHVHDFPQCSMADLAAPAAPSLP
jgi:hypothetical protein